ncbi:MAG: acyltransferase [Chthoniobacter sp.]
MPQATAYDYARRAVRWWNRRRDSRKANDYRRRHVGESSLIDETVHVLGWQQVRIGHHTIIAEGTWINVNNRDETNPAVIIGDNSFIGRRNFFTAGSRITIGDYCLTGPDCHFLGADHDSSSPFTPFAISGVPSYGVIEVGANCWFGSSVIVLKNVHIGFGSILGAGALITRDCPPFSMLVGSPARIIKRFDMQRKEWVKTEEYPADGDRFLPGEAEYLAGLRSRHPAIKGARGASGKAFGDL